MEKNTKKAHKSKRKSTKTDPTSAGESKESSKISSHKSAVISPVSPKSENSAKAKHGKSTNEIEKLPTEINKKSRKITKEKDNENSEKTKNFREIQTPKQPIEETHAKTPEKPKEIPKKEEEKPVEEPKIVFDSTKYNPFGFELDDESKLSSKEKKLRKAEAKKESEREAKWAEMFQKNDWTKLEERIMKGIPSIYRGAVWKLLIDPDSQNPKIVEDRMNVIDIIPKLSEDEWKVRYQCWKTINDDVARTMPENGRFKDPKMRKSLENILRAYSVYDTELGFTQGMAFHAAILLLYMDEKSAYYCFRALMYSQKYMIRNFFISGFPQLFKLKEVWNYLLKKKYPKVYENIEQVDFIIYGAEWFLSAFLRMPFVTELKLRVFDRYIAFGTRALISFGLVIISRHKDVLANSDFDDIITTLQGSGNSERMQDWRYVMKKYDQHWLSQEEYVSVFEATGTEYFP